MATRDRRDTALASLERLEALPERPPVVLVDNGSGDGTVDAVRERFGRVSVIALDCNRGAAARTLGVERAATPYVAFADDDSWWEEGALARAEDAFDAHPRLAVVAARVLVGPERRLDPTCEAMAASAVRSSRALPGRPVLGFVACGAVVRREAYLEVGGFEARYGVGGEERLLAFDLAAAGWDLAYVDAVVAHHHPAGAGQRPGRRAAQLRNDLWTAWLRRPLPAAARRTAGLLADAGRPQVALQGAGAALAGLPWVLRDRRPVPPEVEEQVRRL